MRIMASGWQRHHGEREIMNGPLGDADADPDGRRSLGQGYLRVEDGYVSSRGFRYYRERAKVKVAAGTEDLRLGGRYRLTVEFSREEIAKLFYAVHDGDTVQTFRALLEEEDGQERLEALQEQVAQFEAFKEQERRREAEREKRKLLEELRQKLASPKQPPNGEAIAEAAETDERA
jgi:hypothetical protein